MFYNEKKIITRKSVGCTLWYWVSISFLKSHSGVLAHGMSLVTRLDVNGDFLFLLFFHNYYLAFSIKLDSWILMLKSVLHYSTFLLL